jgi:hypothetical protein
LQATGEALQPIGEALGAISDYTGNLGYQIAGPTGGAIGKALPTLAGEVIGLKAPALAARVAGQAAKAERAVAGGLAKESSEIMQGQPTQQGMTAYAQAMKSGAPEDIAGMVDADPAFFKATEDLGIQAEPLPSYASRNPQYRALEQGLASIPTSDLDAKGKAFISDVTQRADRIITESGGTIDKPELSFRFREENLKAIDDIYDAEKTVYDAVRNRMPEDMPIQPSNTLRFIELQAKRMGGHENLPGQLKKLYRELKGQKKISGETFDFGTGETKPIVTTKNPTFELLNHNKKLIGQQLGRGDTTFKNMETGQLKALYAVMKADIDDVAKSVGAEDVVTLANDLTKQRKSLENGLQKLLGRELQKDLMPIVGSSLKGIKDGKIEGFERTINAIPEGYRQEVVVSALNDIFRGGAQGAEAFDATQFTKFMNSLDRSPKTKAILYKQLPTETVNALESLKVIAKGISDAKGDKITTGRISAFFDDNNGLLRKMMGAGAVYATGNVIGPLAGMAAAEFLQQSSPAAQKTALLMQSTHFQNLVKQAAKEGVFDGNIASAKLLQSQKALEKSARYKQWADTLGSDKAKLASMGLLNFLAQPIEDENQVKENRQ